MDRFIGWFWGRFRRRYFFAQWAFAVLIMAVCLLGPVMILVVWLGEPVRSHAFALEGVTALSGILMSVSLGILATPSARRPIDAWLDGDHRDPHSARDAALVVAERMSVRGIVLSAPYWLVADVLVFGRGLGVSGAGYIALALAVVYIFMLGGFFIGTGFRLLARPILEELAGHLPPDDPPGVRVWTIRSRLLVGLFTAAMSTGMGGVGAAYHWGHSIDSVIAAGFGGVLVMGIYVSTLFFIGVVQPTLRPLGDLIAATERVSAGDFSQSVSLTSTDELGDLVLAFNEMTAGLRQREALKSAFGTYVDPALASRLLSQDSSVFDGETVEVTVFFADVRGFTTYADLVEPEEAVAQLNRLFEILVPAIRDAGGHPNRCIGDGVLAVFGTPEPLVDHADAAVQAALAIQQGVRARFGEGLRVGIGINSGKVIAGSIGAAGKLDFTVIGDVVNVAARVEEHTKETGDAILVTQATVDAMFRAPTAADDRGQVTFRGKDSPIRLYAIGA